jgi:hypothetical protein
VTFGPRELGRPVRQSMMRSARSAESQVVGDLV